MQVIRDCAQDAVQMLGVCLGHQALGEVFGGTVTHAHELMHGKTSQMEHKSEGVLAGLPDPFTATRYHSLAVVNDTVSDELEVTATAHGIIMGLQHVSLPLHGVQFHPESVLTEGGHRLLANWLELCGDDQAVARSEGLHPLVRL
jgi:para-aminobenzoate synthetase component 2